MDAAVETYLARWQAREPALRVLPAFLPVDSQQRVPLWLTLLNEFDEAMFEVSDPAISQTKLAWWGEELAAGLTRARHPLARALLQDTRAAEIAAAHWQRVAQQAIALATDDASATDWSGAAQRWAGFCQSVAEIESRLFMHEVAASSVASQWRLARCLRAVQSGRRERAGLPLSLWATHADRAGQDLSSPESAPVWRSIAEGLSVPAAERGHGPLHRQFQNRLDRLRLQRLAAGQGLQRALAISPWRSLWLCWRSARASVKSGPT